VRCLELLRLFDPHFKSVVGGGGLRQSGDEIPQQAAFFGRQSELVVDLLPDVAESRYQRVSGARQCNGETSFVCGIARPADVAQGVEPLQYRRQRWLGERQLVADRSRRVGVAVLEREEYEELRVGQMQRVQKRAVHRDDGTCCCGQQDADLRVHEAPRLLAHGLPSCMAMAPRRSPTTVTLRSAEATVSPGTDYSLGHDVDMGANDDEAMMLEAVEWLRTRLPGRSDVELRKIVEEELLRARVQAALGRRGEPPRHPQTERYEARLMRSFTGR
jgi:hypothetical protein